MIESSTLPDNPRAPTRVVVQEPRAEMPAGTEKYDEAGNSAAGGNNTVRAGTAPEKAAPPMQSWSSLKLPAAPESVGEARSWVRAQLEILGMGHHVDNAQLAVSELVTNAVLHAKTEVELQVGELPESTAEPSAVLIAVADQSAGLPTLRAYGVEATTGRGLALVSSLSQECGVERFEEGKRVWMVLSGEDCCEGAESELALAAAFGSWSLEALDLMDPDPDETPQTRVVLRDVPAGLWSVASEYHDSLLRELLLGEVSPSCTRRWGQSSVLWRAARAGCAAALPGAEWAQTHLAASLENALGGLGGALEEGASVCVELHLESSRLSAFEELGMVLELAEELAEVELLLTPPMRGPVGALREWILDEVRNQSEGGCPHAWDPAEER